MGVVERLLDAEFEVMKVAWANQPPVATGMVMEQLGKEKEWRAQTTLTFTLRLAERGFLRTEKNEKERIHFSLISKEEYLKFETGDSTECSHGSSFTSLVTALYDGKKPKENDLGQLKGRLKEKRD